MEIKFESDNVFSDFRTPTRLYSHVKGDPLNLMYYDRNGRSRLTGFNSIEERDSWIEDQERGADNNAQRNP